MNKISYKTAGVCSSRITVDIKDGRVAGVEFTGGCPGNTFGLSRLAVGRTPEELIGELRGIRCGRKATSCPDQLSRALADYLKSQS